MKKLRDWVALLSVGVAFAMSLTLIRQLIGMRSPWFGLIVMLDLLGLAAFARPVVTLRLPGFLLWPSGGEGPGRLYKLLRVPEFGALLRRTALRRLNPLVYLTDNRNSLAVLLQTESAEVAHLLAAVVLVPWVILAYIDRQQLALATLLLVQILGNLYPILHLRWARVRISRLQQRAERQHR